MNERKPLIEATDAEIIASLEQAGLRGDPYCGDVAEHLEIAFSDNHQEFGHHVWNVASDGTIIDAWKALNDHYYEGDLEVYRIPPGHPDQQIYAEWKNQYEKDNPE